MHPFPFHAAQSAMATIEELLAALKALPQHFRSLSPSEAAVDQAFAAADLLDSIAESVSEDDISHAWDTILERCVAIGVPGCRE